MEVDRGIREKTCGSLMAPSCLLYHDIGSGSQLRKINRHTFIKRLFFPLFRSFGSLFFLKYKPQFSISQYNI